MLKNYFKIAWRSFRTDRNYALISLLGLSIAFAVVIIITAYVRYETSFDRYYDNSGNIYRLVDWDKTKSHFEASQRVAMGYTLENTFPEVEGVTYFWPNYDGAKVRIISDYGSAPASFTHIDTSFFDVFDIPFVVGSFLDTREMGTVILTKTLADQLFPEENPIGQTITRPLHGDNTSVHIVRAVVGDIPSNSHFRADAFFVSKKIDKEPLVFNGGSYSQSQYILLKDGVSPQDFQKKINTYFFELGMSEKEEILLFPVQDIHLHASHIEGIGGHVQNARFVYIFGLSGILVLLIGSINYVNLYLAKLIPRSKEMGIRKVMGAGDGHLVVQIWIESAIFFVLSLLIGILFAYLCWPAFSHLLEVPSDILHLINGENILIALIIAAVSSSIVSIYPAIRLKRDDAIDLIRQKTGKTRLALAPQKVLLVFQFVIAVVLVIATVVIHTQVQFFTNRSMGFDKDYLLMIPNVQNKADVLKEELLHIPTISDVSFANHAEVGTGYGARSSMTDPRDSTQDVYFGFLNTDMDFLHTMRVKLMVGRNFSLSDAAMSVQTIHESFKAGDISVNERAAKISQIPIIITESTAKRLDINSVDTSLSMGALQGTVIGIVKDFQLTSFKEEGAYAVFRAQTKANGNGYIRLASHDIPLTIARIKAVWQNIFPNEEFNYHFVDDQIRSMYKKEDQLASLFNIFSLISMGISALGLFSLIALIVKQRTKEIGIRKVLGASVGVIVAMLSKDFVKLVLISIVIASPIAWWAMNKWLEDFAYRIDITWWMFALAGFLAVLVALLTVSGQAIRAAVANPVDSLRDE